MSEVFKGPSTAAMCNDAWVAERRTIIRRDGYPVRAGVGNTIELKTLTPREKLAEWDPLRINAWAALMLPGGTGQFATAEDRDAVLQRLLEKGTP